MIRMKVFSRLPALLLLVTIPLFTKAQSANFYIASNGNDASTGRKPADAFATLQKARDVVRVYKNNHPSDTIFVNILEGDYSITEPIVLTAEDGGTQHAPVIYRAYKGKKVVLNGGRKITAWQQFKNKIWVADLPKVRSGE